MYYVKRFYHRKHAGYDPDHRRRAFPGENLSVGSSSEIGDFIVKLGKTLDPEEYDYLEGDIWIAKSAKVAPTAYINGPAIIGKNTEVRHCAFIRGKALVGEGCVVGNSTELKNVVLFNNVQVPHYNYVGDAVLGYKSHMGAGSICSNVKSDKKLVVVKRRRGED